MGEQGLRFPWGGRGRGRALAAGSPWVPLVILPSPPQAVPMDPLQAGCPPLLPTLCLPLEAWLGRGSCPRPLPSSPGVTGSCEAVVFLGKGSPGALAVPILCQHWAGPPSWAALREPCALQVGAGVPQRGEPWPGCAAGVPGLRAVLCHVSLALPLCPPPESVPSCASPTPRAASRQLSLGPPWSPAVGLSKAPS